MGIDTIRRIDALDEKLGGRFVLTALIQRRIQDVVRGSPSFSSEKHPIRAALAEIAANKVEFNHDGEDDES